MWIWGHSTLSLILINEEWIFFLFVGKEFCMYDPTDVFDLKTTFIGHVKVCALA